MLKFKVLINGLPPDASFDTADAYLANAEDEPIRGEIRLRGDTLFCEKKAEGLAALVLPWTMEGVGRVYLSTAHLPDRERPYNLQVELLRGRILQDWTKKDDWGYIYRGPTPDFSAAFDEVKKKFAQAVAVQDDHPVASRLAGEALATAVSLGELLTLEHAKRGLIYRRDNRELVHLDFGCWVELDNNEKLYQDRLCESFNYATLPFDWRHIEPREQEFQWQQLDAWVKWLDDKGLAIKAGQLLRFTEATAPDWLYIFEADFDSIRDYAFEHVLRCVKRYGNKIEHWDVATGLHVENCLKFTLDQIMEMTTMSSRVIKKNAPQATTVLDLVMPWGEYAARNQRSIWPVRYVEMCINGGVEFDAIGLQVYLGADDFHCRDMMQVSNLLDVFGSFGKPLHITAAGVPSRHESDPNDLTNGHREVAPAGCWHRHWDEEVQSQWVDEFYHLAVGKPFVTAVCWTQLSDRPGHYFPHAGLLGDNLLPKRSYHMMLGMKKEIWPEGGIMAEPAEPLRQWDEY